MLITDQPKGRPGLILKAEEEGKGKGKENYKGLEASNLPLSMTNGVYYYRRQSILQYSISNQSCHVSI